MTTTIVRTWPPRSREAELFASWQGSCDMLRLVERGGYVHAVTPIPPIKRTVPIVPAGETSTRHCVSPSPPIQVLKFPDVFLAQ